MTPPDKPDSKYLELPNGVKLHYTAVHSKAPGEAKWLILLQGSGPGANGWLNFRYNAQAFADQGFNVLIPDLPGFGDSDKPDTDYTLDFFSESIFQFTDALGVERFSIVGNSLGGAITIFMAIEQPQRIDKVILMGCGGLEDQSYYFQHMEGIQAMVKVPMESPEFTPEFLKSVLQLIVFDPAHITDELIAERYRITKTQHSRVFTRMVVPNLTERLSEIQSPVLAFWGKQDRFCPARGIDKIAEHCQSAETELLDDCGHWLMIEYPKQFNDRCLKFLQQS